MNEEYEIQHFSFSVKQIREQFKALLKLHVQKCVKNLTECIIKKVDANEEKAENIRRKIGIISEKILNSMKNVLKEIDQLHSNTFSIPENVLLFNDIAVARSVERDENELIEECDRMETMFKQNGVLLSALDAERELYYKFQLELEKEIEVANIVETALKANIDLNEQKVAVDQVMKIFKPISE